MKALRFVLIPIFLIVVWSPAILWAQAGRTQSDLSVVYLDGTVERKSGTSWITLAIGDSVPADATIRVSKASSIELSRGGTTISFLMAGSYLVSDALQKSEKLAPLGIATTLSKLKGVVAGSDKKVGTVAGVRGASQSGVGALWVDDLEETRAQVKEFFAKAQFADAIPPLEEALECDLSVEENEEMSLLLATAHDALGQIAPAWSAIAEISPLSSSRYYVDIHLAKAGLLMQSTLFSEALSSLSPVLGPSGSGGEQIQQGWLLAALCHRALGDELAAKKAFDSGLSLDPSSGTGKQIAEIMKVP